MATIVPNAGDTSGGNKYEAIDQAEPDSIDFELLGQAGSGVLTGCAVTSNSSSSDVAVSAGVVVLNGIPYTVAANSALGLPSAPTDNRFDIVVARISGGSAVLTVVQGVNSATNPQFPQSASVLSGAPTSANINFSTDVVLASLYRSGAATVTTSRIVDKRRIVTTSIFDQGTVPPASSYGNGTGSLFYVTGAPNGTASGVHVKTSAGTWVELAQNVGAHSPIGAAFIWPSTQPVPAGCVEANGQLLSTTAYAALFTVYGYTHGGSGSSFGVPDYNNRTIRGTTSTGLVGTTVGSDNVTLSQANLPVHTHTMDHTHTYAHTHGYAHTHTADHSHTGSTAAGGNHTHVLEDSFTYFVAQRVGAGVQGISIVAGPNLVTNQVYTSGPFEGLHSHTLTVNTAFVTTAGQNTTNTSSQSASTTSTASVATTSSIGSGTSFSVIPASSYARYIIRASLGTDPAWTGGSSIAPQVIKTVSSDPYTLVFSDAETLIRVQGNSTIQVPTYANVPFPVGTHIDFFLDGAFTADFVALSGVTIRSEALILASTYTCATLIHIATDIWALVGRLT